jgi:hypothetical protein
VDLPAVQGGVRRERRIGVYIIIINSIVSFAVFGRILVSFSFCIRRFKAACRATFQPPNLQSSS